MKLKKTDEERKETFNKVTGRRGIKREREKEILNETKREVGRLFLPQEVKDFKPTVDERAVLFSLH